MACSRQPLDSEDMVQDYVADGGLVRSDYTPLSQVSLHVLIRSTAIGPLLINYRFLPRSDPPRCLFQLQVHVQLTQICRRVPLYSPQPGPSRLEPGGEVSILCVNVNKVCGSEGVNFCGGCGTAPILVIPAIQITPSCGVSRISKRGVGV